jgi:FkbM family methyltransferase
VVRARLFLLRGDDRYTFPALDGLDRRMVDLLPDSGVFLEVGANDGFYHSNTFHLEVVKSWKGILIEPLPSEFRICRLVRRRSYCVRAACVSRTFSDATIDLVDMDNVSIVLGSQTVEEETERIERWGGGSVISVPARPISDIIDESGHSHVDFMSIDVEGAELELLAGLDLERHTPDWMLVETAHEPAVTAALDGWMTFEGVMSKHDYLYRRATHAGPTGSM